MEGAIKMSKKNLHWKLEDLQDKPGIKKINMNGLDDDYGQHQFQKKPVAVIGEPTVWAADNITWVIDPIPAPRLTKRMVDLVRIPESKLAINHVKVRKKVERYMDYKTNLKNLAISSQFKMPESGFHVTFFFKTKDETLWGTPHQKKPDTDNLMKAFKDALSSKDENIWDYRISKRWASEGKIKIEKL